MKVLAVFALLLSHSFALKPFTTAVKRVWDVFGRVPHDDFLFKTANLVNPQLLKRTFTETVIDELPYVLENYRRKKRLGELTLGVAGLGCALLLLAFLSFVYKSAMAAAQRRMTRDDSQRGITFSTSAISKKAARKGRNIDGMNEGWLDMDYDDDDDSPKDKGKKPKKNDDNDDE